MSTGNEHAAHGNAIRNLVCMEVEESIRANPLDGVVLLGGCDKTTPALVMGAASCDVPAIIVSAGPMLNGQAPAARIGSGTEVWRFSEEFGPGRCLSRSSWRRKERVSIRRALYGDGHRLHDGSMVEALGLGAAVGSAACC